MQENKALNQRDLYASAFAKISPDVTSDDRKAAMKELELGKITIINYLGGKKIMNFDTAQKLLNFFNNRISDREKEILEIINN